MFMNEMDNMWYKECCATREELYEAQRVIELQVVEIDRLRAELAYHLQQRNLQPTSLYQCFEQKQKAPSSWWVKHWASGEDLNYVDPLELAVFKNPFESI
jgi:hypothetical protein